MAAPTSCIFCRIAGGAVPAKFVLQTEGAVAFLDSGPLAEGHLLLVPKTHAARLEEMTPDAVAEITRLLPALARALLQVTGAEGFNVLQNNGAVSGQSVDHVHFHLIPRRSGDGLGYRWLAGQYPPGRAEDLQERYRRALSG
ncbi:MAG TPA: HIT family protein [Phycisphaerae bacterium]|jgi:histidine triad (HIT) family protein